MVQFLDFAEPRTGLLVRFKTVQFRFSTCPNHESDLVATIFLNFKSHCNNANMSLLLNPFHYCISFTLAAAILGCAPY